MTSEPTSKVLRQQYPPTLPDVLHQSKHASDTMPWRHLISTKKSVSFFQRNSKAVSYFCCTTLVVERSTEVFYYFVALRFYIRVNWSLVGFRDLVLLFINQINVTAYSNWKFVDTTFQMFKLKHYTKWFPTAVQQHPRVPFTVPWDATSE